MIRTLAGRQVFGWLLALVLVGTAAAQGKRYETRNDFESGIIISLNNDDDKLSLTEDAEPLPFIWVPQSGMGPFVARIDTATGDVVGTYKVQPGDVDNGISKVRVDKLGNCWVSSDFGDSVCNGTMQGTLTRIGVVIGGTRVNADGSPNPNGEYLAPPYDYTTVFDRDGDGLIRTSVQGFPLEWLNEGGADTCGGVSTAEDEAILNFTRVVANEPTLLAVDRKNDVWVGGNNLDPAFRGFASAVHERISGILGTAIPGEDPVISDCGGDAGVVRPNGTLWSVGNAGSFGGLLSIETDSGEFQCRDEIDSARASAVDPTNGHIWFSRRFPNALVELDVNGDFVQQIPLDSSPEGIAVDSKGGVWVAMREFGAGGIKQVERLVPDPTRPGEYLRYMPLELPSPQMVSIDEDGLVWIGDSGGAFMGGFSDPSMYVVQPNENPPTLRGGTPAGEIINVIELGSKGLLGGLGDGTGFGVLSGTAPEGRWTVVFDSEQKGTPWGTACWESLEPRGTRIDVFVRAAEEQALLASEEFFQVQNAVSFNDIKGRFIEIQVVFAREFGAGETPVLDSLKIEAAECHMLVAEGVGDDLYRFGRSSHAFQTRLRNVYKSYPVLMESIPSITLHLPEPDETTEGSSKGGLDTRDKPWRTFHVQVVMWNPRVFPANSEQSTPGLRVDVYADGRVTSTKFGEADGQMDCEVEVTRLGGGLIELRVPFVVGGM